MGRKGREIKPNEGGGERDTPNSLPQRTAPKHK